jgi:hypothetical protein
MLYSYSHPIAGDVMTKKIIESNSEELTWVVAEKLKTKIDLMSAGKNEDIVQSVFVDILLEVRSIVDFCEQKHGIKFSKLVLLGGGGQLFGVDRFCQNYFAKDGRGMEVSIGKSVISGENDSFFLESVGLAMRGVGVELPGDIDLSVIKAEKNNEKIVLNKRLLWIEENLKILMISAVSVCLVLFIVIYFALKV